MSLISLPTLPSISPELATPAVPASRGAKAAEQFEAQLIGSMLESMEKTLGSLPGEGSMPGSDDFNYLGTHALAETLAAHGGFGLAALIVNHLPEDRPGRHLTDRSVSQNSATLNFATRR